MPRQGAGQAVSNPSDSSCENGSLAGLRFQLAASLLAVEAIALQWDLLLERSFCNRAFSCSKWFLAVCRPSPAISPLVFTAWRNQHLAGVFPLVFHKSSATIGFATPLSDYNDMIAVADDRPVCAGLLDFALRTASGSRLVLSDVRPDSNCVNGATALAAQGGTQFIYEQCRDCLFVKLSGTFEEYVSTRSRLFRKGLRRIRKEASDHNLEIRHLTAPSFDPGRLAELFLALHFGRFGDSSHFESAESRGIINGLIPALFQEERLHAFMLLEGGKAVAIDLCMRGCTSLCTWNGGRLPEAARWSPGRLLLAAEVEHAFASNLEEFDLLRGAHPYKASWATDSRKIGNLSFGAATR
jgi:CelD/BcsL family acetyltransferase involved in cellulose biosynthesis